MRRLIPPYLLVLLAIGLGLIEVLHPASGAIRAASELPWDVPLLLGLPLLIWARLNFKRKRAEVHTFRPPTRLVTDGPFRFSRNPMYLGFLLVLLALALLVNTWCALLVPFGFFVVANSWYIPHEERTMRRAFGSHYEDYAWSTRRWI